MGTVEYTLLIAAAGVGFIVFHEVPTMGSLAGMALIIAASFIAVWRDPIRAWITSR
jgi:drug/metabolite transporter (DMT)-like permease